MCLEGVAASSIYDAKEPKTLDAHNFTVDNEQFHHEHLPLSKEEFFGSFVTTASVPDFDDVGRCEIDLAHISQRFVRRNDNDSSIYFFITFGCQHVFCQTR